MRYLYPDLERFADNKIVLLAGPRQVGKTTVAKAWLESKGGTYLNWDIPEDREDLLMRDFMSRHRHGFLCLDEFHKYARWKSWLKGLYDKNAPHLKILVTGSARLDVFQKGGDSLLGRYELLRLHPFSIGEKLHGSRMLPPKDFQGWMDLGMEFDEAMDVWQRLERFSGFPEPYEQQSDEVYRRWSTRRRQLLIREDLREISQIRQISLVEHLSLLLPDRVGSLLSLNALRENLQVAHDTVSQWLDALERLYYCFRISPYHEKLSRGLKKEQKLYLWNWTEVTDPAARFENMVASHLLKSIHYWNDIGAGTFELCFARTKEKKEIDFVILSDRKPAVLIEVKEFDLEPSQNFELFGKKPGAAVPRIQIVRSPKVDRIVRGVRIVSAEKFLAALS